MFRLCIVDQGRIDIQSCPAPTHLGMQRDMLTGQSTGLTQRSIAQPAQDRGSIQPQTSERAVNCDRGLVGRNLILPVVNEPRDPLAPFAAGKQQRFAGPTDGLPNVFFAPIRAAKRIDIVIGNALIGKKSIPIRLLAPGGRAYNGGIQMHVGPVKIQDQGQRKHRPATKQRCQRGIARGKLGDARTQKPRREMQPGLYVCMRRRTERSVQLGLNLRNGVVDKLVALGGGHLLGNDIFCGSHGDRDGLIPDFLDRRRLGRSDLILGRGQAARD